MNAVWIVIVTIVGGLVIAWGVLNIVEAQSVAPINRALGRIGSWLGKVLGKLFGAMGRGIGSASTNLKQSKQPATSLAQDLHQIDPSITPMPVARSIAASISPAMPPSFPAAVEVLPPRQPLVEKRARQLDPSQTPLIVKKRLMTPAQWQLYRNLVGIAGQNFFVLARVRLHDVVIIDKQQAGWQKFRPFETRLKSRPLDFVLCRAIDCKPVLAIELDDAGRSLPKSLKRDQFKTAVLARAGLQLLRLSVKQPLSLEELSREIASRT